LFAITQPLKQQPLELENTLTYPLGQKLPVNGQSMVQGFVAGAHSGGACAQLTKWFEHAVLLHGSVPLNSA
jgi:hypothetical protein